MSNVFAALQAAIVPASRLVRARAKVLAREDRQMRSELVRIRRQNSLTQRDVADALGITPQAIQKLERYDADPKLSTLRRYANAVGALVEHRVTPDLGQSLALASASPWESVATPGAEATIWRSYTDLGQPAMTPAVSSREWSEARRSHFALGA